MLTLVGLLCCMWVSSSFGKFPLVAVHRVLIAVALLLQSRALGCTDFCSLAHGIFLDQGLNRRVLIAVALLLQSRALRCTDLSSCGAWRSLLLGTRDPPGPGIESVSLTLQSRFLPTGLPGKPLFDDFPLCCAH